MMITLIIYLLIIGYIILKAFYTSIFIKLSDNNQNIEKLNDSINLISMPFYIKMFQIHLLCIFINLILISLFFLPDVINNLFSNNIAYCQDHLEEYNQAQARNRIQFNNTSILSRRTLDELTIINKTYEISDTNLSFIYHLNYKYIGIQDHLNVFRGFSQNLNDLLNKQNFLFQKISFINKNSYTLSEIYKEIYQKNVNTLSLTSNSYKNMMFSYNDYKNNNNNPPIYYTDGLLFKILNNNNNNFDKYINQIIRDFIGDYHVGNLNKKITNTFNTLEEIQRISKENYNILEQIDPRTIHIPSIKIINIHIPEEIKNYNELLNYCNEKLLLTVNKNIFRNNVEFLTHGLEKNDSMDIHKNINYYHDSILMNQNKINIMIDKGFFFKEKTQFLNLNLDDEYESFNINSTDENIFIEYKRLIEIKKEMDRDIAIFREESGDY